MSNSMRILCYDMLLWSSTIDNSTLLGFFSRLSVWAFMILCIYIYISLMVWFGIYLLNDWLQKSFGITLPWTRLMENEFQVHNWLCKICVTIKVKAYAPKERSKEICIIRSICCDIMWMTKGQLEREVIDLLLFIR